MDLDKKIEEDLLANPLSMLGGYKLQYISEILSNNGVSTFLEIGTWVGGSTYVLSNKFPNIDFHTIDVNDYHEMYDNNQPLVKIAENHLGFSVGPEHIESIQNFYEKNSPNAKFYNERDFIWRENYYDVILIDGDHNTAGLQNDLRNCYSNIKNRGFIIVDDISFAYLKRQIQRFFTERNQKVRFYSLEVGKDLAVIKVNRKKDRSNKKEKNKDKPRWWNW